RRAANSPPRRIQDRPSRPKTPRPRIFLVVAGPSDLFFSFAGAQHFFSCLGNHREIRGPFFYNSPHYIAILPVVGMRSQTRQKACISLGVPRETRMYLSTTGYFWPMRMRSEEHTSELQSRRDLVCRLLLEKKKKK